MDDIVDMGYQSKRAAASGAEQAAKYENKTLWSYSEAVKTDQHQGAATTDEGLKNTDKILTLDERIEIKLAEYDINVETELGIKEADPEEDKLQREKERAQLNQAPKTNAKHHYDKEDLISFH